MEKDLISVIVPIYNIENYLDRCVKSILNQSYKNLEVVLVDDGSPDNCPKICDEWAKKDKRVKVVHKKNGGLSSARNAGIDAATGEYIGFVDGDDYIDKDMYFNLITALKERGGDMANIKYVRVLEDGSFMKSLVPHEKDEDYSGYDFARELLMHLGDVSSCTKLYPHALLKKVRFRDGVYNEDILFMFELVEYVKKINFVEKVGYFYYDRNGSITNAYGASVRDMVKNSLIIKQMVKDKYPELMPYAERFALVQHMGYLLLVPKRLRNNKNEIFVDARIYIKKNVKTTLKNKWLTKREKIIILGLTFFPALMYFLRGIRNR